MEKTIQQFIRENIFLPRLNKSSVLVVYDPERRYRELCLAMDSEKCVVVDATESSILSREKALATLQKIGKLPEHMLVYVQAKRPLTDEERQNDPFAMYEALGAVFPQGDGDEYQNICLKAKADFSTEIRRIFAENPDPPFAVIDAVGGGAGWPTLRTLLATESARNILLALMAPTNKQLKKLKSETTWIPEAKSLFVDTIGFHLKTKMEKWEPIAEELWRFVLFSEFVLDLPGALPETLANVPHALPEAKPLIYDLCERLRDSKINQHIYIERAERIEAALNLKELCKNIEDLGVQDTFPFEERSFFLQATDALKRDNLDVLREIIGRHKHTVWVERGENHAQWLLLEAAMRLVQECADKERLLPDHTHSQEALIDFYTSSLRLVDQYQREFEQAERDVLEKQRDVDAVIVHARRVYRKLANKAQSVFVRYLEQVGWPPAGRLANTDVLTRRLPPG
jgi:hypothetical protein